MSAPVREVRPDAAGSTEDALTDFFADGARHIGTPDHRRLWEALADSADGGKRLRPALFHSVYEAFGGRERDVAARVGAAVELLHTALVVHDDVIDGDTVRRGRPNVAGTFGEQARAAGQPEDRAGHYGAAAAILAGDLALAGAVRMIALCGAAPATVARMLDDLDRALHLTAAGELTDVRLSMGAGSDVAEAITMEQQKTAVYSFELPLRLAAVLAGADERHEEPLTRFARLLGVAYQLQDDLDGMFGEQDVIGKSTLSDLREGKHTPLVAHARTTEYWPRISPYLASGEVDETDAAHVRRLLERCGARRFVESLVAELAGEARGAVAHLPVAPLLEGWVRTVLRTREAR
ncbi:polyprenyl synthetase family protein [Georgenia sp. H159]|uniref:polyprenyl synthetase family protein n=1 Tax=Georgenia sp. H159 TaxID=3076115 RepID=UPI002D779429|nr:polyprenyl synthetase family protein [Georgenia sp. H159]